MRNIIYLLALQTIGLLGACTTVSKESSIPAIDVVSGIKSVQPLNVTDLASTATYIPLETHDSCLVGEAPCVRKFKDKLLVSSQGQPLFMFDATTGKFLKKVGAIGKGKGEYLVGPLAVCWTDCLEQYIYVKSVTGQVLKYDTEGNFVDYQKEYNGIDNKSSLQLFVGDDCYFYTDKMVDDKVYEISKFNTSSSNKEFSISESTDSIDMSSIRSVVVYSLYGRIPSSPNAITIQLANDRMVSTYKEDPCLWKLGNEVYFKHRTNDTIYQVKDQALQPRYYFNLGDYHITYEGRTLSEKLVNGIFINYVLENSKAIFFSFKCKKNGKIEEKDYWGIFDKQTQSLKISEEALLHDAKNGYVVQELHSVAEDGTLVGLVSAEKLMELDADLRITEDDNPVVVLMN